MRSSSVLLLVVITLGLVFTVEGVFKATSSTEVTTGFCPEQIIINACIYNTQPDAVVPRGTASIDTIYLAEAIVVQSTSLSVPTTCRAIVFESASLYWSSWTPPLPVRPPRSLG